MRNTLIIALLIVFFGLLQSTVFVDILRIDEVKPDLLLIVIAFVAFKRGGNSGLTVTTLSDCWSNPNRPSVNLPPKPRRPAAERHRRAGRAARRRNPAETAVAHNHLPPCPLRSVSTGLQSSTPSASAATPAALPTRLLPTWPALSAQT